MVAYANLPSGTLGLLDLKGRLFLNKNNTYVYFNPDRSDIERVCLHFI